VTGDTLVFRDGANNRLAIVSPREGMLRELSLAGRGAGGISQLFGRDSTGTFFFLRWSMASLPPDAPSAHRQPVMLQSWRGGSDSIVDHFVGGEIRLWREVITRGPGVSVLTRSAALTVEPQFRIWGDKLLVASGGEWRLDRRDPNGAHLGSYRVNRSAAPLTDSVWSQYVDQVVASRVAGDSTLDRSAVREQLAAEEHEGSLPAFETVVVTPDQTAWALDYRLPGDSGWAATAFDLRGRILGRIVEPRGDPPVAFGNDRLAFRTEDEDGIATITVRRIRMPE
jgi:hypothetical protein